MKSIKSMSLVGKIIADTYSSKVAEKFIESGELKGIEIKKGDFIVGVNALADFLVNYGLADDHEEATKIISENVKEYERKTEKRVKKSVETRKKNPNAKNKSNTTTTTKK